MKGFNPVNYKISLTPDLVNFKFSGTIEISGEVTSPLDEIKLNILELTIWKCGLQQEETTVACSFYADPDREELHIKLPRAMSGPVVLEIKYEGTINNKMAGFYRSGYQHDGTTDHIAVTQFQESDARRAFPCLDHPLKKATFDIEMIVDDRLTAISNETISVEEALEKGKKRVIFRQTPRMSTYLLFFGVGAFDFIQSQTDPRVRAVTIPGRLSFSEFGLEFGRLALEYCEAYYQIAYPLAKMDLIAVPDFAFGAMENWGAITFRENLLLHYPDITSRSGEERICEVIAHEIAHQWFGNLVTPSDWKYLWLNESFATFFGYGVVDHHYPQWEIWSQFLSGQTTSALVRDGLHETFAIEIPGGEHVVINTSTAPIIYSKGGSILRQIKGYIGEDNFRHGLNHYLNEHAYDNAASHHLWEAFEAVTQKPITKMMQSWIEQPGFPVITAEKKGTRLVLRQERFTYLPNTSGQLWDIPVNIRLFSPTGDTQIIQTVLEEESLEVDLPEDIAAYKINADQTGFFRTRYLHREDFDALGKLVHEKKLPPEDRWGLENDLFAMVRSGAVGIDDYLNFLADYQNEDAYLPLVSINGNLYQCYSVFEDHLRERIAAVGKALLVKTLTRIGYNPQAEETFTTSLLRDQIILPAVLYGSEDTAQFGRQSFDALMSGEHVHADILKSVMQIGALTGNETAYDWLRQRFESSGSEHERMNILYALGCFSTKDLIDQVLRFALDEVPDRNKFIPIVAMCTNTYATDYMWDWYLKHIRRLEQFHPLLYERVIAGIIPTAGMGQAEAVREFFDEYMKKNPQVKEVVRLSLEKLEINLRMRDRNTKG
jgi:tricorn protease interacting factor F2/3